ncbi:lysophospholipase L1-like esterase [Kineococcus xinjiangensis]|uniref:Lysophospholipase L1-like esterase n=1 Tax=Kineococcus xinjiangensis TaxID=512762 RepID=A0A2S6IKL7_9ACTN|nr:GDSL-type esterase/lipase family protein [Kineococcus xinjiangensis]PPK94721.1 lysophospholipase L1-like esterase [Kineococcus xinjiangensis]
MPLHLALLGDSLAHGTGATRATDALGPRLATALTAAGVPAESRVFAVPGALSDALARQVTAAVAWRPGVALVVIGGNDVRGLVPPERAAAALAQAVRALRTAGAAVVVVPAPDLSVVSHVPPALQDLVRAASAAMRSAQSAAAAAEGARIADPGPRAAAAFASDPGLFSADRFHPSSAGYALIAEAVLPVVRAAATDVLSRRGD